eukprot:CAMPEP_0119125194 /NCGR_PEP_ID=MMETSP1310-20130426/4553_1 /TAXON_ID=464262 /ORGANISM="Genus nov. species nov., Strain RCC2339" /LENGTH=200 /DNA_ID=CAMNT_0007115241 /DNA_START=127 /DNA_END=726 /DNA_ORIENTATION=-
MKVLEVLIVFLFLASHLSFAKKSDRLRLNDDRGQTRNLVAEARAAFGEIEDGGKQMSMKSSSSGNHHHHQMTVSHNNPILSPLVTMRKPFFLALTAEKPRYLLDDVGSIHSKMSIEKVMDRTRELHNQTQLKQTIAFTWSLDEKEGLLTWTVYAAGHPFAFGMSLSGSMVGADVVTYTPGRLEAGGEPVLRDAYVMEDGR